MVETVKAASSLDRIQRTGLFDHEDFCAVPLGVDTELAQIAFGNVSTESAKCQSFLHSADCVSQPQGVFWFSLQKVEGQSLRGLLSDARQPDELPDQFCQQTVFIESHLF